nr:uncharacterized protein LOC109753128 [Aegilops tauschii subsp. strangulata]
MGDNLNANDTAPVAPYVFLSFLFEIVRNIPYIHSCFMDGLVDASKVPYGCERYIDQHSLAEHSSGCAHMPCYCYGFMLPFWGSPASLVCHLPQPTSDHYWPAVVNIKYEMCYPFAVPESLEDHHRLLALEEDDNVFLLTVGTGQARAGRCPVSVVCVRGNTADADTRPV